MQAQEPPSQPTCPICGCAVQSGAIHSPAPTLALYLMTLLGLVLAGAGAWVSIRILPRFAGVVEAFRWEVPPETAWVLRSGVLQPLPGCLVMMSSLLGILVTRHARTMLLVGGLCAVASIGLLVTTWLALLLPEFVLV